MKRLSEDELGCIERLGEDNRYQRYELVRGYRRAVALEDMLREWVEELDVETCEDGKCPICGVSPAETHEDACPVERTRALLAEGDE